MNAINHLPAVSRATSTALPSNDRERRERVMDAIYALNRKGIEVKRIGLRLWLLTGGEFGRRTIGTARMVALASTPNPTANGD